MNHLLFFQEDKISENELQVSGHRKEHILKILKLKKGDKIKVGEYQGKTGFGIIKVLVKIFTLSMNFQSLLQKKFLSM